MTTRRVRPASLLVSSLFVASAACRATRPPVVRPPVAARILRDDAP